MVRGINPGLLLGEVLAKLLRGAGLEEALAGDMRDWPSDLPRKPFWGWAEKKVVTMSWLPTLSCGHPRLSSGDPGRR